MIMHDSIVIYSAPITKQNIGAWKQIMILQAVLNQQFLKLFFLKLLNCMNLERIFAGNERIKLIGPREISKKNFSVTNARRPYVACYSV